MLILRLLVPHLSGEHPLSGEHQKTDTGPEWADTSGPSGSPVWFAGTVVPFL